jgi:hypothetical protein
MIKNILWILISIVLVSHHTFAQLEDGFKNPPIDARPKGLWTWVNGNFNYPQIKSELEMAKEVGMGGFDIWDVGTTQTSNPPRAGAEFLGHESLDAIEYAINEAGKQGLEMGLIISSSWNAGGTWINEQHSAKGIFKSDTSFMGGKKIRFQLPKINLPSQDMPMTTEHSSFSYQPKIENILIMAYDQKRNLKINLSPFLIDAHNIEWQAPEGEWKIIRIAQATTGEPLKVPSPKSNGLLLDHFSAEAQEHNLTYILKKLSQKWGNDFSKTALKYLYSDSYEVAGSIWTPRMIEEFTQRRKYNPTPLLPAIFDSTFLSADSLKKFRYDLAQTFSDLIIENHYEKAVKMCQQYGIGFAAEAAGPGAPVHNCPFESIKSSGILNYARGEFWLNKQADTLASGDYKLDMIKGVACAAHVYGKKYVEAESFTTAQMYSEDFNLMKKNLDNAFTWGLNRIVFHTFQHNPQEAGKPGYNYPFGVVFGAFQPWFKNSRGFNDYIARASYMLQQGNFVADVLIYYGDQAPNFVKEHILAKWLGSGYDYDVINSEILISQLTYKNGYFELPSGQRYKLLAIQENTSVSTAVLPKIEQLLQAGAPIWASKPKEIASLSDLKTNQLVFEQLSNQIWGNRNDKLKTELPYKAGKIYLGINLATCLKLLKTPADFFVPTTNTIFNIRYIHRRTSLDEDIYFISNQTGKAKELEANFRVLGKKPELWDALTGKTYQNISYQQSSTHTQLKLVLPSNGSVFVIFRKNQLASAQTDNTKMSEKSAPIAETNPFTRLNGKSEAIDLSKNWEVRFLKSQVKASYQTFDSLYSWTQSSIPDVQYYAGEATYYKTFTLEENQIKGLQKAEISFDSIGSMADVWLNGKHLGSLWCAPYTIDISQQLRAGSNNLVINVSNGINNRRVGDGVENSTRPFTASNIDKGECAWCKPWNKTPLQASGIWGKAWMKLIK